MEMMLNGGNVDVGEAEWGFGCFQNPCSPISASIATEGNKGSLENQKACKAACSAGSYCPLDFRHIQGSAPISRVPTTYSLCSG